MLVLSYGYKKPQTGDAGSVWFPAMEDNIQRLNDHDHDGTDSAKLTTAASVALTNSAPSGSWVSLGGGNYRQLVTMPGALLYNEVLISPRDASSGHYYGLTIEKVSANTYYVYINDNSKSLTMVYTS